MISKLSTCIVTTINRFNLKMSLSSFKSCLLHALLNPGSLTLWFKFICPIWISFVSFPESDKFLQSAFQVRLLLFFTAWLCPKERLTFILLYVVNISVSLPVLPPLFLLLIISRCIWSCLSLALTVYTCCSFHSHFSCYLSLLLPAYSTPSKSQPLSLITLFFSFLKTFGITVLFPLFHWHSFT